MTLLNIKCTWANIVPVLAGYQQQHFLMPSYKYIQFKCILNRCSSLHFVSKYISGNHSAVTILLRVSQSSCDTFTVGHIGSVGRLSHERQTDGFDFVESLTGTTCTRKGFKPNTVMTVTHDVSSHKPGRVEAAVRSPVFAIRTVDLPTLYFVSVVHHGFVRTVALNQFVCFCIHPKPLFITPSLHLFITSI